MITYADRAVHGNIYKHSQLVWNIDRRKASIKPECSGSRQQQHARPESSAERIQPTPHLITERATQQLHKSLFTFSSQLTKISFILETPMKTMLNEFKRKNVD